VFEASIPAIAETSHGRDALAMIAAGLAVGISPGFRIPPKRAVPDAEEIEEEDDDPDNGEHRAIIRTIKAALLYELSIVTRAAYSEAQVEARNWCPGFLRRPTPACTVRSQQVEGMMATTIRQTEGVPGDYPVAPSGLSTAAAALDAQMIWQRIEAYVAHRWHEREVDLGCRGTWGMGATAHAGCNRHNRRVVFRERMGDGRTLAVAVRRLFPAGIGALPLRRDRGGRRPGCAGKRHRGIPADC
jgi:hypothetical protein